MNGDASKSGEGHIEPLLVLTGRVDSVARSSRILLDSGATTNFVSSMFVAKHGLSVTALKARLNVRLADGSPVDCLSYLPRALIDVDGHRGRHDLIVLPALDDFDVILGRAFLVHSLALVDHAAGRVSFGVKRDRKIKLAKSSSQASLLASVVAEMVEGQSATVQDQVIRACGLMATPLEADIVPRLDDVAERVQDAVAVVVKAYEERMKPMIGKLPPSRGEFDHAIRLIDPQARPRARKAIPLSERHLKSLAKELDKLLAAGLIRPSRSEWAAPVFFVPKDDVEDRMIIDLRQLNEMTETNSASLPYVKELFGRLGKAMIFSKIDLTSGYHQLRLRESDVPLTGFITPLGHFEWLVTPFGEKNSPASFSQLMSQLVLVFQDDILIASESDEEHVDHVQQVLARLSEHHLWIKPSKCQWGVREVDFLGHHIRAAASGTVIEPCQSKVDAIAEWPVPSNRSELGSFLGLANYYRSFVNGFSELSAPLTALTTPRISYSWSPVHQRAFEALKQAMCSSSALLAPDDDKPFILHCDASSYAIGAVLSQHDVAGVLRPVGFYSSKLTDTQLRWDVYEREIYSVVAALQHWFFHLKGAAVPVQIFTDHQSLEELNVQLLRPKLARWFTVLSEYRYRVTWIPASQNAAADALSRRHDHDDGSEHRKLTQTWVAQEDHMRSGNSLGPGEQMSPEQVASMTPMAITRSTKGVTSSTASQREHSTQLLIGDLKSSAASLASVSVSVTSPLLSRIKDSYLKDEECVSVFGDPARHGYRLVEGLLLRHGDHGVLVPNASGLRESIMAEAHEVPMAGHAGVAKSISRLVPLYYWPGLTRDVAKYVSTCLPCQRNKGSTQKPHGLLKPIPITKKGEMLTLDFIGPVPRSRHQMNYILVMVDKMTKRVYYEPCRSTITARQTAQIVFRRVVREQGLPSVIVSDRDSRFTSNLWHELWSACGTKLSLSTAYHQQTDGQSERQVRTLEEGLRAFVNAAGTDWDGRLPHVEFAHNTAVHASTGFAPLQLHAGVLARTPMSIGVADGLAAPSSARKMVEQMSADITAAQSALKLAQERQKRDYDNHHRHVTFSVGDYAWLSTADRMGAVSGHRIWRPRFDGPYKVIAVETDGLNVTLDLPASMKIHPVFHVSKLKVAKLRSGTLFNEVRLPSNDSNVAHSNTHMKARRAPLSHSDMTDLANREVLRDAVQSHTEAEPGGQQSMDGLDVGFDVAMHQEDELDDDTGWMDLASGMQVEQQADEAVDVASDLPSPLPVPRRSGRRTVMTQHFIHDGRLGEYLGFE